MEGKVASPSQVLGHLLADDGEISNDPCVPTKCGEAV
jgi:hypothetical protein